MTGRSCEAGGGVYGGAPSCAERVAAMNFVVLEVVEVARWATGGRPRYSGKGAVVIKREKKALLEGKKPCAI